MIVKENDPCYLLNKAAHFLKCRVDSRLSEIGLTFAQFRMIECLYENEKEGENTPLCPATLADDMHCERPTMTGLIDRLEKQGLVQRNSNPKDRRSQTILLTDKARSLISIMDQTFTETRSRALAGFSDQECGLLLHYLERMVENLNKE